MTSTGGQVERARAVAAFDLAMERWHALPVTGYPSQVFTEDGPNAELKEVERKAKLEELALRAQVIAVEAFTWARAFHDIAIGKDDFIALAGYPPHDQVQLMLAARFVANKGIHVMARFSEATTVPTIGGYARRPYGGGMVATVFRWVDETSAPPATSRSDIPLRDAFCDRWAGKSGTQGTPVVTALREVEALIHQW